MNAETLRAALPVRPRRFGVGWTLNFGNPWAWLVFVAIIGGAAALSISRRR